MSVREPLELVVHDRDERFEGGVVPLPPGEEEPGDVVSARRRWLAAVLVSHVWKRYGRAERPW
jgi:hypothetical protein